MSQHEHLSVEELIQLIELRIARIHARRRLEAQQDYDARRWWHKAPEDWPVWARWIRRLS